MPGHSGDEPDAAMKKARGLPGPFLFQRFDYSGWMFDAWSPFGPVVLS